MHDKAMKSGKLADFQEYLERTEMFMVERRLTAGRAKIALDPIFKMSPAKRKAWKREQMQNFTLGNLTAVDLDLKKIDTAPSFPMRAPRLGGGSTTPNCLDCRG